MFRIGKKNILYTIQDKQIAWIPIENDLLLLFVIIIRVCTHVWMCAWNGDVGTCLYVCMQKQEKGVRYFPSSFSTFFFPPSLNLKFTISTKLAGQQVPNLHVAMLGLQAQCSHI